MGGNLYPEVPATEEKPAPLTEQPTPETPEVQDETTEEEKHSGPTHDEGAE